MRGISEERCAELTPEYIRKIIYYEEDTGIVTWRVSKGAVKAGTIANDRSYHQSNKAYGRITINGKKYNLHRIIWLYVHGEFPETVDHINGNGLDNRLCNLRNVDRRTNSLNRKLQNNNISGIHGVTWHKRQLIWQVGIHDINGYKYLGKFDNIFDAACVRKSAEIVYGYHKNHGAINPELPEPPK